MNILFLTLGNVTDLSSNEIYPDLLRELHKKHHNVYVACGREKRQGLPTELSEECGIHVLRVRIGNITRTNLIEKGISTLTVEHCFRTAIDRYFKNIRFDLVTYSTPPITFSSLIRYLKHRDGARTYLMLKDIFPQNAVDLGMFGEKSLICRYFRHRERALYSNSDKIGCMSAANVRYLLEHNPGIDPSSVEIFPNALEIHPQLQPDPAGLREKFGIPKDSLILLFGGNLGKPQGIDFLISCLKKEKNRQEIFFVIAGSGTEYDKLNDAIADEKLTNTRLLARMSSEDYNALTAACDVGLIVLDHRFTIPNYPSRILPYMHEGKPILAATDRATDLKETIEDGGFGWWCPSDDTEAFDRLISQILLHRAQLPELGAKGRAYLEAHFNISHCADTLCNALRKKTLIVSQCFYPSVNRGGPAVSVTNLAAALAVRTEVSVLTASYESGSGVAYNGVHEGKNRLFDCDVYYESSLKSKKLQQIMELRNPDCIYISSLFSAHYTLPALRYARKHRLTTVLAPRGELQEEAIRQKKLKKSVYLAFLKLTGLLRGVRFHSTSTDETEQIRKRFPKAIIYEAQNLPRHLKTSSRTKEKAPDTLRAVSVCRVHPIKGLDIALKALSSVTAKVAYDIYGPFEDESFLAKCRSIAQSLPENITVRFCGAISAEKLPQIYADSDVFLLPTKTENFGNAIVEAMLCGLPAIISNGTPWKALAEHEAGENADTVKQYSAAINRFAAMTEDEWKHSSENASAYIESCLNTEETMRTYLQMIGGSDEASLCAD